MRELEGDVLASHSMGFRNGPKVVRTHDLADVVTVGCLPSYLSRHESLGIPGECAVVPREGACCVGMVSEVVDCELVGCGGPLSGIWELGGCVGTGKSMFLSVPELCITEVVGSVAI